MERVFHRTTERYSTLGRNTITTLRAIFSVHYTTSLLLTRIYNDLPAGFIPARGGQRSAARLRYRPGAHGLLQLVRCGIQALQQLAATTRELHGCALPLLMLTHLDKLILAQRENVRITFFQMPPRVPKQHERREFVMTQHRTPPLINAWMVSTS
jgi:hypothetical protein